MRIKWYQKAILPGLVALAFISIARLTSVSLDTFLASFIAVIYFTDYQGSKH